MKKIFTFLSIMVMGLFVFTACEKQPITNPKNPGSGSDSDKPSEVQEEYVDLGLSVKWATCNLGATKPEEYGSYFMWGDVDSTLKVFYGWDTYKYCAGTEKTLTKYCTDAAYGKDGFVDNKTELDSSDDAAAVILGGKWRMPTAAEADELLDEKKCSWEYVTVNGVKGARVTSKVEGYAGRSIFLPAAGFQLKGMTTAEQESGSYWCKSLCTNKQYTDPTANGCAFVHSVVQKMNGYMWQERFYGYTIRPVHP